MANESRMIQIKAEHQTAFGVAQIARYEFLNAYDHVMFHSETYRFDMCLTPRPRNARACYVSHRQLNRYQKLGSIYLLPPGKLVNFKSDAGTTTCVVCDLQPKNLTQWLGEVVNWDDPALLATLNIPSARIRALLLHLGDELRNPGFAAQTMVELILAQLGLELSRSWRKESGAIDAPGLPQWRLRLIEERLSDGKDIPTLSELAALCNISVRHLTRGFMLSRGCSIGTFIAKERIEVAKQRLQTSDSIKGIARELGFGSPSSFAYSFRKCTGATPREYRARYLPARSR